MDTENTKKNSELVWASIFVNYVNKKYHTNYQITPELGENSPIDMHLECEKCTQQHIDLQLTYAVELPFVAMQEHAAIDFSKQPTIDAIERKREKLESQHADLTKIVLVIQGYMNESQANEVFKSPEFDKFDNYPFAGIYYVSPPMVSGETDEHMQEGLVVPIKEFFK